MKKIKTANFEVEEIWTVGCPECFETNAAPFNHDNPMEPMQITCDSCGEDFILTYDRSRH